jgi:hypothetical protein
MQYFDFSYLVNKYSTCFTAVTTVKVKDKRGIWKEIERTKTDLQGAIIAHRQSKILNSNGAITEQDRALYTLIPLSDSLKGAKIVYDGKEYSITSELNNSPFTGVWAYNLHFVSALDKGGDNSD